MARIKIIIPDKAPIFSDKYRVGISDLNYGNHLGNDKVLTITHEIRMRWLKSLEVNELHFFDTGLIMNEAICSYKSQAYFGDILTINLYLENLNPFGLNIITTLNSEKRSVAITQSGMLFFNYQDQRIQKSPEKAFEFLSSFFRD